MDLCFFVFVFSNVFLIGVFVSWSFLSFFLGGGVVCFLCVFVIFC